ncbi:hypothetical protein [Spirosoma harenae]
MNQTGNELSDKIAPYAKYIQESFITYFVVNFNLLTRQKVSVFHSLPIYQKRQ